MKTEGTERTRGRAAAGLLAVGVLWAGFGVAAPAGAQDAPPDADKSQAAAQQVDPATKKLMAAHGLYQRG